MTADMGFRHRPSFSISSFNREIVLTSEGHLDLLGRRHDQVIGHHWQEWLTDADFAALLPDFESFRQSRRPYDVVSRIVRTDGSLVPVLAHFSVLRGRTVEADLVLAEVRVLDQWDAAQGTAQIGCAEYVRDLTYEMAALTGRNALPHLTQDLIDLSASAEYAVDAMSRFALA